jgi:alpha-1,2-mannosyltransferase
VDDFKKIPNEVRTSAGVIKIVSIAQFRPEKDHVLQLKAFSELRNQIGEAEFREVRLLLIGSCRNIDDKCRVAHLKYLCSQMGIDKNVDFLLNVSYSELKSYMAEGMIGLHTMWNEHFGIGLCKNTIS